MRLTLYTDYSLRVLLYVGMTGERLAPIREIAQAYGISRNHLLKVVNRLASLGYVETTPGKSGGVRLAQEPGEIVVGRVIRQMEPNFHIVECFEGEGNACPITTACALQGILDKALGRFLATLDEYTLADLLRSPGRLQGLLHLPGEGA